MSATTPKPWRVVMIDGAPSIQQANGQPVNLTLPNAHLASAAPELLDACRELCQRLESNELVNRPGTPGNEYDQPAYDRALAAIAKAEGRE